MCRSDASAMYPYASSGLAQKLLVVTLLPAIENYVKGMEFPVWFSLHNDSVM